MEMIFAIKTMNLTFRMPDDSIAAEVTSLALFDEEFLLFDVGSHLGLFLIVGRAGSGSNMQGCTSASWPRGQGV